MHALTATPVLPFKLMDCRAVGQGNERFYARIGTITRQDARPKREGGRGLRLKKTVRCVKGLESLGYGSI